MPATNIAGWVLIATVTLGVGAAGARMEAAPLAGTSTPVRTDQALTSTSRSPESQSSRIPPVPGERLRAFEAPAHEYGPGHRGIDLAADSADVVVSPAAGVLTFAGPVAGRGVVVIEHAGNTLTSLEPVEASVAVGTRLAVGDDVAIIESGPGHVGCTRGCLHWGVRIDDGYVDPWWWLGRSKVVRLLPLATR